MIPVVSGAYSIPQPAGSRAVAAVADLRVTFRRGGRDIHALRGISLDIREGEILGLVGESGSGKSVLGLSLLGLLPAEPPPVTAGSVTVRGDDMLNGSAGLRRSVRREHLGAVFQDPMTSLNPTMRVGRQVIEAAGSRDAAIALLRAVGVPDAERRMASYPHELSGGLRQRVMIAMAVAGNPALVIADEPTTALDVIVQAQVLGLLRSLRDEIGCSFLMITHDLGVAAQVADRVAVMYGGRLAELGPTRDVLRSAAHPYSVALTRSRLSLTSPRDRPLATLGGEVPDPADPPPGCPFEPRCALATPECSAELPEPAEVAHGHLSACILPAEEVAGLSSAVQAQPPDGPGVSDGTDAPGPAGEPAAGQEVSAAARMGGIVKTFRVRSGRRRGFLVALRGIDLHVDEGESVAIVGESGSGKSTLLRIVAGLDRADQGEVMLGPGARPQMVFQDAGASLTPWMAVGSLIGERLRRERAGGRRLSAAQRRERVAAALAHVGLPAEVASARAAQLSGGQRQRVALARATVIPPEVLLCDEPTSALDVSLAAVVLNLIARLRRELGMAVLFVTHDLSVARVVADRIAVMYLGRIVEIGGAADVVARPRHPYTKALVNAVPDVGMTTVTAPVRVGGALSQPVRAGGALSQQGESASPLDPPAGCAFHPRCPIAEEACADPELIPRLTLLRRDSPHGDPGPGRMAACIRVAGGSGGSSPSGSMEVI
jgi:peptide/nickel transport system ATP-binding protein